MINILQEDAMNKKNQLIEINIQKNDVDINCFSNHFYKILDRLISENHQ